MTGTNLPKSIDIPKKSGIYKFTNLINGKTYFGQSINLRKRYRDHLCLLRKGINNCTVLQHAWNKYGEENFRYQVMMFCPIEELKLIESFFIDSYNSLCGYNGYNMKKEDVNGVTYSDLIRGRLSVTSVDFFTGETTIYLTVNEAANAHSVDYTQILAASRDGRETIVAGLIWFKTDIWDGKWKKPENVVSSKGEEVQLISPTSKSVTMVNPDTGETKSFPNYVIASDSIKGCSISGISAVICGKLKSHNGLLFFESGIWDGEWKKPELKSARDRKTVVIFPNGVKKEFRNANEAGEFININPRRIRRYVSGTRNNTTEYGFEVHYKGEVLKSKANTGFNNKRKIKVCFNDGEPKIYPNMKAASLSLGFYSKKVSLIMSRKHKNNTPYKFSYA